jgi:hypothetical protein
MKLYELYQDPAKHCKRHYALNVTGLTAEHKFGVSPDSDDAVAWCLSGAIERFYPSHEVAMVIRRLEQAIRSLYPQHGNLIGFNDHPATSVEMVREVCKLANV